MGKDDGSVTVSADDDLMTRAEKIVHVCGFRGAAGGFAVDVFRVLQAYEKADRELAEFNKRAQRKANDVSEPVNQ